MFKRLLLLICLVFVVSTSAQWSKNGKNHFKFFDWKGHKNPMLEFNYGIGSLKNNLISNDMGKSGNIELKLGYSRIKEIDDYLIDATDKYIFFSRINTNLQNEKNNFLTKAENIWRAGFGQLSGMGYRTGFVDFILYSDNSLNWNHITKPDNFENFSFQNQEIFDLYNDNIRFGTSTKMGLKIVLDDFVAINGGYEASVIYPRYLFWKQTGSYLLEAAALGAVDSFIDEITDSSPAAGPIVNFILKNGISYAFFELRKDDMAWPFDSTKPFNYQTFKIGLTFTF